MRSNHVDIINETIKILGLNVESFIFSNPIKKIQLSTKKEPIRSIHHGTRVIPKGEDLLKVMSMQLISSVRLTYKVEPFETEVSMLIEMVSLVNGKNYRINQ